MEQHTHQMDKKFQNYLINKFPNLYKTESLPFSKSGFECDDGWFKLILWLSRYLTDYIKLQNEFAEKYPNMYRNVDEIKVLQVKEKFGILKYYTSGGNDHTKSAIGFAEYISGFICEQSGRTNDVGINKKGCIKTHHKEFSNPDDFYPIDDEELRLLLNPSQLEFNF